MNDHPQPKDFMTVVITVSTVLLALTPVFLFLAIQQTHPAVLLPLAIPLSNALYALYAVLTFSFISGLVTIGLAVEWFDKDTVRRKHLAKCFLICQTTTFTFGSFTLLSFTIIFN